LIVTDDFQNYDYGIAENHKRYKQQTPPSYDLKKITTPMILFYSENDPISTKEVTVYSSPFSFLLFNFYLQMKAKHIFYSITEWSIT